MRAVLQRVARARVEAAGRGIASIGPGLLVFAAVASDDSRADADYLAGKIAQLRILSDEDGRMNRSVLECGREVLLVSQFTLLAETRKGRRPSFSAAAPPEMGEALISELAGALRACGVTVLAGEFGAHMNVELVNDGPVTIVIDSNDRNVPRRRA